MKKNPQSWFEVVKEKIQAGADRLNISMDSITESAIAFGAGFAAGYLTKKFGRSLLFLTVLLFAVLVVLHYVSIITIDWPRIKTMIGLSPDQDFQEALNNGISWAKAHVLAVGVGGVAFFLGFIIG